MKTLFLAMVLVLSLTQFMIKAQFPHSDPYAWSRMDNRMGAYGGGNGKYGSLNIGGRKSI